MTGAAAKLLSEFEALPADQKQEFVRAAIQSLLPWQSGPLYDELVAGAADDMSAMLEQDERASQTW